MRFFFAAVVTIVCTGLVYAVDRVTSIRAQREGYPVGYHPLTIDRRQPPLWQWALGAAVLFAVAFGAAGAIGIGS